MKTTILGQHSNNNGDIMTDEANTAPPAPAPKTAADKYADFINKQNQSSLTSRSSGPVTNDEIARATGKIGPSDGSK